MPLFLLLLVGAMAMVPAHANDASRNCPAAVRIGMIDYELPPLVTGDPKSSAPQGQLADWTRHAIARSGCSPRVSFERMPVRRGRSELARGSIDIWAVAVPDHDLYEQGLLPMTAGEPDAQLGFYRTTYSLYVLHDETRIHWDGKRLQGPPGLTVGISPVGALDEVSRAQGWQTDKALDTANALQKLLSGRHLTAILPDRVMASQPVAEAQRVRRLAPPVLQAWFYAAASKGFGTRYPAFMRNYWQELCTVARSQQPGLPACAKALPQAKP